MKNEKGITVTLNGEFLQKQELDGKIFKRFILFGIEGVPGKTDEVTYISHCLPADILHAAKAIHESEETVIKEMVDYAIESTLQSQGVKEALQKLDPDFYADPKN